MSLRQYFSSADSASRSSTCYMECYITLHQRFNNREGVSATGSSSCALQLSCKLQMHSETKALLLQHNLSTSVYDCCWPGGTAVLASLLMLHCHCCCTAAVREEATETDACAVLS
jgi:hypothetical protein